MPSFVVRRKSDGLVLQDNASFGGLADDPYLHSTVEDAVLDGFDPNEEDIVEVLLAFGAVVTPATPEVTTFRYDNEDES